MDWIDAWEVIAGIQSLLSCGTAYRLTKRGGDNGVSLAGWLAALNLASLAPGLGFYLGYKHRDG